MTNPAVSAWYTSMSDRQGRIARLLILEFFPSIPSLREGRGGREERERRIVERLLSTHLLSTILISLPFLSHHWTYQNRPQTHFRNILKPGNVSDGGGKIPLVRRKFTYWVYRHDEFVLKILVTISGGGWSCKPLEYGLADRYRFYVIFMLFIWTPWRWNNSRGKIGALSDLILFIDIKGIKRNV